MAKNGDESTAVNELINLVAAAKPLPMDPDDDLMFRRPPPPPRKGGPRMTSTIPAMRGAGEVAPLPRTRAPNGTQQGPVIASAQSIRMATAPGGAPTIPPISHGSPPPIRTQMPINIPIAAPFEATMAPTARPRADVTWVGAAPRKSRDWNSLALKVGLPMVALLVAGVLIGGYFGGYFTKGGEKRAPSVVAETSKIVPATRSQPAAAEEPKPVAAAEPIVDSVAQVEEPAAAPAPAVAITEAAKPLPTPAGQPVFVDVRIDSQPTGATVMIVDRGKTAFLGTTPLRTAVDPARQYDLVFTYTNKPTQLEHLDPKATQHLEVVLGKPGAKSVQPAEVARVETKVETKVAPKAEAPRIIERQAKPVRIAKREEPKVVTMPEIKPSSTNRVASKIPAFDPAPTEPAPKAAAKIDTKVEPPVEEVAPAPTVAAPATKTKAELRAEEKALKDAARLAKKAELDAKKQELAAARIAKKQEQEQARASKASEAEAARIAKKQQQEQARTEKAAEAEAARLAKKARGTFDGMLETPGKGSKKKLAADKPVAETAAEGFIMVSSKPACEILIDGKETGLTSPQKAIPVPLGKHKVTLVNTEIGVKKTLTVTVTAGEATKVIQDFTK